MTFLSQLSHSTGLHPDTLKTAILLIANYPLAFIFKQIPTSFKHLYSILVSAIFFNLLFESYGFLIITTLTLTCYIVLFLFKRHYWCPIAVFVLAIGTLGANHLYNQMIMGIDSQSMDHTAPMMVLVMKITSFAWSIYDGVRPESELSNVQKRYRITEFPPLIDFLGYIFFFPCFMIGPTFQFVDYNDFIHKKAPFDKIPDTTLPALFTAFSAIVPFLTITYLSDTYYYDFSLSKEFSEFSFLRKGVFLYLAGMVTRCTFYVGWKLSEGACILTGLGYAGKDSNDINRWNRTLNVDMRSVEFAWNPRMLLSAWNINTAEWLKRCVYFRISPEGTKVNNSTATFATFLMSAFWHGFWPGYYFSFISMSMATSVNRLIRKYIRPIVITNNRYGLKFTYDVLGWIATQWIFAYFMPPFFVRGFYKSLQVFGANYFSGHIIMLIIWIGLEFKGQWLHKFMGIKNEKRDKSE